MTNKIGHYEIVAELGRGGMGIVYKGYEASLNRYVAIKVLSPSLSHDASIKERFLREARSMAALNDPHIIQIYYIGEHEEQPYIAMEFVEGESLSNYLKRETRLSPEQAARVIFQTAQGLMGAHDKGVIHRDIKPANLMLNSRGRIKIADFGIAFSSTDFSKKLTSTGEFVGTPGYLSPEVCTGQPVDQRSDVFSLGIVFFELLAGQMPFTDESPLGLMLEVVKAEIPNVRELNAEVDDELQRILQKMTAKSPTDRYQSCHELAADLGRHPLVAGNTTITAKPEMSVAAQTAIGMKTPLHNINDAAQQTRLNDQASAKKPLPAAPRPSVLDAQSNKATRKTSMVWPIAAVFVLGAAGATTWAFRDQIPYFSKSSALIGLNTSAVTSPNTTSVDGAATAQTDLAASSSAIDPAASTQLATQSTSENAQPQDATINSADASNNNADASLSASTTAEQQPVTTALAQNSVQNPIGNEIVESEQSMPESTSQSAMTAQRNIEPAANGAVIADHANATRNNAPTQVAMAPTQPRVAAPVRPAGPPKVAVIVMGDPALTAASKHLIEESLLNRGFVLLESDLVAGVRGGDLARNLSALARHGAVAVVTIKAEPMGTTQLNYYGQSDTLYSANLTIRAYDVHNRSPLNSGMQAKVDFTALNANEKAQEAIEPGLARLMGSLAAYRPRANRG